MGMFETNWCGVAATTVILFCSHNVFAWSANGHKTVALIAWDLLTQDTSAPAKTAVSKIQTILNSLGSGTTLEDIAPCADQLRGESDDPPTSTCRGRCAQ